jgi:hypothetical protein
MTSRKLRFWYIPLKIERKVYGAEAEGVALNL